MRYRARVSYMPNLKITFFNTIDKSTEWVDSIASLNALLASKEGFYWLDLNDENPDHFTDILRQLGMSTEWRNFFKRPEILPHMYDSPWLLSFYLYDIVDSETLLDSAKAITQVEHAPIFV